MSKGKVESARPTGPVIDSDYSFFLFFPATRVGAVLEEIAELAVTPFPRRTDLVLPDGSTVTVPFRAWQGDRQTISLLPGSRVCLHTLLSFPAGGVVQEYRGQGDPGRGAALLASGEPLYVRLWVYMGDEHAGLVFFPPDPQIGWYFVESAAVHRALTRLLERHEGLLGVLTDGVDKRAYLLPHLDAHLEVSEPYNYLRGAIDIEAVLSTFQAHTPRPSCPPTTDLPRTMMDAPIDHEALVKVLERVMGAQRGPIPQRYQRTFEERPFEACDFCAKPLLEAGTRYTITKVHVEGELRQELAICLDCTAILEQGYSEQSRRATQWLLFDFAPGTRLRAAMREDGDPIERMTRSCLLCDTLREEALTFVEYAACEGGEIVYQSNPFLICETCLLRINDLLSDQTKEAWRRFWDDHFGFPTPGAPALAREYYFLLFG